MSAVVQHNISLLVTISIDDAPLYKQAASLPVNITSNQTVFLIYIYIYINVYNARATFEIHPRCFGEKSSFLAAKDDKEEKG